MNRVLTGGVVAVLVCAAATATAFDAGDFAFRVTGADKSLGNRLESASLVRQAIEDKRTAPDELIAAARAEYRQLLGTLYGQGYYSPVIHVRVDGREAADISPLHTPAQVNRIEVLVEAGNPFAFSRAQIDPLAPGTDLPEDFRPGATARVPVIQSAARTAVSGWRDIGYAKAELTREDIVADHARNLVSVDIGVRTGPRLRFGPLVVQGNERVRTERILQIAGLPTGEVYSPEELEKAADRLRRTGAFRAVSLRDAEQIGPGDQLAIMADLVEEKRRRLGAGVELSSTDGLRVNAYWMHRNLLGGAERLRFDLDIENIGSPEENNGTDYTFTAAFRRPATGGPDRDLYILGSIAREDEPGYLSDSVDLGFGFTQIFSDTLEARFGLLYRAARVEDAFGERDYQLFGVPLELTWDTRDDELNAHRGFFVQALAQPFAGLSGIDNGALIEVDGRAYRAIGERVVLAGRAQLGSLIGPDIEQAPPDYLFFAGGGGSVRGQPYQTLGTGEFNGRPIGGRSYVALSAEARVQVRGPIGLVGFYDAGYVGAEEVYDGSGQWISGAGLGVRYDTGFGPIRFDVATPLESVDPDASKVQVYIGIGQAF